MNETYAYQKEIAQKAIQLLKEKGKAAIVSPTGTGKSYIAAYIIQHLLKEDGCALWCVNHTIICDSQREKFLSSSYADIVPYIQPLTYTSAGKYEGKKPFVIILDEFHHIGAEQWMQNILTLINRYPDVPILGLSATPFRPSDKVKVDDILVPRNMADEFFEGNYAVEMYYADAWMDERISLEPPIYVAAAYLDDKFNEMQKSLNKIKNGQTRQVLTSEYEKMRRSLENAYGVRQIFKKYLKPDGHYIFFCRNLEHLDKMKKKAQLWLADFSSYELLEMSYQVKEPEKVLKHFAAKDQRMKILFAVDMIGEGIHVDCDGVILSRPTKSVNVEIQQIGRASKVGAKDRAVIIDLVSNITYMIHLKKAIAAVNTASGCHAGSGIYTESFVITDETIPYIRFIEIFERKIAAARGSENSEDRVRLIIHAYLYKHAPLDFCLKELKMTDELFQSIVRNYQEEVLCYA